MTDTDYQGLAQLLEKAAAAIRELSQRVNALEQLCTPDENLGKSIRRLDLNSRVRNCLESQNIEFIGQLISMSENQILNLLNSGDVTLENIRQALGAYGMKLKGD